MALPTAVAMFEVGPRDGLQNEPHEVDTALKVALIGRLAACGLVAIESTSFVSPKRVPRMADNAQVMAGIARHDGVSYPVLTPNMRGYEDARAARADTVCVFSAASETFSQKNTNCSIAESLARAEPIVATAKADGIRVRGYISCVLGCPYEGDVDPATVAKLARTLDVMGCYEISLGDTVGFGTPLQAKALIETVAAQVPVGRLAAHFHDTYGQALANLATALDCGVAVIDSSLGGLGGCPYAKGAKGNVATEDVLYMLTGMGIETGIDLEAVTRTSWWLFGTLGRRPNGRVAQALGAKLGLAA
ncbi:MAG TPA: hydroxymethylglutaryl-CoA lyase [Alphaproteobacteria bacterium]|jgi:hydroxymethylglutaryl-CoA lyase|nr:hydroxymethylglutaryl-CoA lyase [Alphaproteobacteria bacterium]